MDERLLGFNFFTVKAIQELQDGYYRITLENDYVNTNDTVLICYFQTVPKLYDKIQLNLLATT